jgi:hypothetical protein
MGSVGDAVSKPVLVLGGLAIAAVLLIVVFGSGGEEEEAVPLEVAAEQCLASQASPIELAPAGAQPQELSSDEIADRTGFDVSGVPETATFYELGPQSDPSYVVLIPADSEDFHATARGGFENTIAAGGFEPATADRSTTGAVSYVHTGDERAAIYGRQGCYSVVVYGTSEAAAERSAGALLAPAAAG